MAVEWLFGLMGGVMIGGAGALYLWGTGQIMGASGILGSLVDQSARGTAALRLFFVLGTIGAPALILWLSCTTATTQASDNLVILILAGLLVGVGTRLANGCTSGHGVCGISRLSLRGIVATLIYIGAGVVTMLLLRHGLGVI